MRQRRTLMARQWRRIDLRHRRWCLKEIQWRICMRRLYFRMAHQWRNGADYVQLRGVSDRIAKS
jgi:hypothetical protein